MQTHELKTWPDGFQAIWDGRKTHELRVNDRNFQVGDTLHLREWDPASDQYMKREIHCEVTYMTPGGKHGLPEHLCVMSIKVIRALP